MVALVDYDVIDPYIESLRTLVLGSSSLVKIPTPWEKTRYAPSHDSFDGLVCLFNNKKPYFVVNPTTRWFRPLPLCQLQQIIIDDSETCYYGIASLAFGKDKFTGIYKPVWLYNSSEVGLETATTCEIFDFSTNAWRFVSPASPYQIVACSAPACVDGSLHWFIHCQETKVVSFDLHTEAFQVICKAPFAIIDPFNIVMCNLDNCLCVSEMNGPNQVIWSFNSVNKTWDKMFSIDLNVTSRWIDDPLFALTPLLLVDGEKKKKKKKLLFCSRDISRTLVIHDPETKSYQVAFDDYSIGYPVCYFQSLISIS